MDKTVYGGIIGMWILCLLDLVSVNEFLKWAKTHTKYMLLVEPIYKGMK